MPDDALFAALYPSLRRFAAVVRPPEVDPDDLVQEALVRLLRVRSLWECDDPGAYLRTAIVRLASNHRRSFARRRVALTRTSYSDRVEPSYPSDLDDLRRLSPSDRALLYLAVVERRPYHDIALLLECTEETARKRLSRALKRLLTEMTAEAEEITDA